MIWHSRTFSFHQNIMAMPMLPPSFASIPYFDMYVRVKLLPRLVSGIDGISVGIQTYIYIVVEFTQAYLKNAIETDPCERPLATLYCKFAATLRDKLYWSSGQSESTA